MTRAARTVAKEIADKLDLVLGIASDEAMSGYGAHPLHGFHTEMADSMKRWIVALAPPKRKVRPRDPARSARRGTVKELDALCRAITFARDGGLCRRCEQPATDWCHVHTRGAHGTRWDLDNSWAGCRGCHMNFWHKQPLHAAAWWREQIGIKAYEALTVRAVGRGRGKVNHVAVAAYLERAAKGLGIYTEALALLRGWEADHKERRRNARKLA